MTTSDKGPMLVMSLISSIYFWDAFCMLVESFNYVFTHLDKDLDLLHCALTLTTSLWLTLYFLENFFAASPGQLGHWPLNTN